MPRVAVNLSARQLRDPDIVNRVERALRTAHIEAKMLDIEITESVLIANLEESLVVLEAIRDLGVSIAIDDFGTGLLVARLSHACRSAPSRSTSRSCRRCRSRRMDKRLLRALIQMRGR